MERTEKHILKRASALFLMVALLFSFTGEPVNGAVLKAGLKGKSYYTYLGKSADGKYYVNQDDHSLKQIKYTVKYGDKKWTGYCMSPGKGFHNDVSYSSSTYSASSAWKALSAGKQELLALVMFYGYNTGLSAPYGNANDYYEATQVLVWEVMDGDVKLSSAKMGITTDRKHTHYNRIKGRKYGVNCYTKIKENMSKHLKGASFAARTKAGASAYVMKYDYKTKSFKKTLSDGNKANSYGQKLASGSTSGLKMTKRSSAYKYTFSASKAGTYTGVLVNDIAARSSQPMMILRPSKSSDQNVVLGAADETKTYVKLRTEHTGKCKIVKSSPDGNAHVR